jgi:hypothetical protein
MKKLDEPTFTGYQEEEEEEVSRIVDDSNFN